MWLNSEGTLSDTAGALGLPEKHRWQGLPCRQTSLAHGNSKTKTKTAVRVRLTFSCLSFHPKQVPLKLLHIWKSPAGLFRRQTHSQMQEALGTRETSNFYRLGREASTAIPLRITRLWVIYRAPQTAHQDTAEHGPCAQHLHLRGWPRKGIQFHGSGFQERV